MMLICAYPHPLSVRERVFPEDSSKIRLGYGSTPYDTISLGIQTLAKSLLAELPDDERFMTKEKKKRVRPPFVKSDSICILTGSLDQCMVHWSLPRMRDSHAYLLQIPQCEGKACVAS